MERGGRAKGEAPSGCEEITPLVAICKLEKLPGEGKGENEALTFLVPFFVKKKRNAPRSGTI